MSEFMEFREPTRIDTSFNQRPIEDYYSSDAIARNHRTSSSRQGRVRDVTWISTTQPSASIYPPSNLNDPQVYPGPPPPPQPISGMPTPVIGAQSNIPPSESDWDAEYMTVDADMDPDEGYGYGYSEQSKRRGGAKTFVGGFVSGLKRLPKAMSKGRLHDRKAVRHDTTGTMGTSQTMLTVANNLTTSTLPQYQSSQMHDEPSNVQYVEASRMPVEEPAPPPQHTPRDRRERSILSAVHEHSLHSHHSHHSRHSPQSHLSNPYDHHEHTASHSSEDTRSQDTSTSNNHGIRPPQEADLSPVFVEPLPSADFARMNPPVRLTPNSDSLRHQFSSVRRFLHEVNDLPWVASPAVSVEYIPGEANRKRYSRQKDTRVHSSWYKPTDNRPLDLLAGSSSTRILPQHAHHSTGHMPGSSATFAYATAPAARSRSPTAIGQGPPSNGGSSEGHGYPVYPTYPQFLSPGTMFVYPQSPPPPGAHSSSGSIQRPPEMQQALPVFMVAPHPHPPFMSPPPPDTGRYSPYGYQVPQVQHA